MRHRETLSGRRFPGLLLAALIVSACAQTPAADKTAGLPPVHHLIRHEDDMSHHDGEFLVLDPPPGYEEELEEMGMSVIEVSHLAGLGSTLYHLKIEDGTHPVHVRHLHEKKYPNVIADVHHHFEQHASAKGNPGYTGRRATKWGRPGPGCGAGIRIGIVDGSVDTKHPAFKGRRVTFRTFHREGWPAGPADHGTAVASEIVGTSRWGGLLPDAQLFAANVFHDGLRGKPRASAKGVLKAISWMIEQRVQVINFSFGGAPNRLIEAAVDKAAQQGIVMIGSAGNNGPFNKKKNYPAAYKPVIAVAAATATGRVANFSSAGEYVEFMAPGVGIWMAVPGGGKAMSGTSFAAPIVAGTAAAASKYHGVAGLEALRAFFRDNAKTLGKTRWDKYSGWGAVRIPAPC